MSNRCILSICIPTFNRADILRNTIQQIVDDPAFDDRVEIVISDNCSVDNTREICSYFTDKYSNVRYFRNKKNIIESNFIVALLHGQGAYVKLHNDYAIYNEGMLGQMLALIAESLDNQNTLFFLQNNHDRHNGSLQLSGINEVIQETSYAFCWVSNVGFWKNTLLQMEGDYYDYVDYNYPHVDWCLKAITICPETIIHYADYYNIKGMPSNKALYNVFQVNVDNLLLVYSGVDGCRRLSRRTINLLRSSVFKHVVFNFLIAIIKSVFFLQKKQIVTDNFISILYKNYGLMCIPYFVINFINYLIKLFTNQMTMLRLLIVAKLRG